jgi:prepilin-type N-terminal cleavage/methylation domain-containing protein
MNSRLKKHSPNSDKDKGFSLIEMVIVLAIIGIITTIGLPVYRQIKPTLDLNAETRDIASDLRYAQQLAVTEQSNYTVEFDPVLNKYTITNVETSSVIKHKNINDNISIQSITGLVSDTAIFNVTGAAVDSGVITLANTNNATTTISIKPSGYVKIE